MKSPKISRDIPIDLVMFSRATLQVYVGAEKRKKDAEQRGHAFCKEEDRVGYSMHAYPFVQGVG